MAEVKKVTISIGRDVHNRSVELIRTSEGGLVEWQVVTHAASQQDETQTVRGLSGENLKEISAAIDLFENGAAS